MGLITVLDTETTGLDPKEGHRIFEIGAVVFDDRSHQQVATFSKRVNPGRAVSAEAARITGVTWLDLADEPPWSTVAPMIDELLKQTTLLVGHNLSFDSNFLRHEQTLHGFHHWAKAEFDTMTASRWATWNGKSPTLGELCFALGVPYDESLAHAALFDSQVTSECYWEGVRRGLFPTPA